jgi:hypothetical protein
MLVSRATLRRETRELVGDDEGAAVPRFDSEILNNWLAAELEKISSMAGWINSKQSERLDIRAGEWEYALPEGTDDLDWLLDPLTGLKWGTWVDELAFVTTTVGSDSPPVYTLRGNPIKLRVKPIPTTDFVLIAEVEIHAVVPSNDRTEFNLRPELKDAVVYAVAARCHQRERDFQMAQSCREVVGENLATLRSNSGDQSNDIHQLRIIR